MVSLKALKHLGSATFVEITLAKIFESLTKCLFKVDARIRVVHHDPGTQYRSKRMEYRTDRTENLRKFVFLFFCIFGLQASHTAETLTSDRSRAPQHSKKFEKSAKLPNLPNRSTRSTESATDRTDRQPPWSPSDWYQMKEQSQAPHIAHPPMLQLWSLSKWQRKRPNSDQSWVHWLPNRKGHSYDVTTPLIFY